MKTIALTGVAFVLSVSQTNAFDKEHFSTKGFQHIADEANWHAQRARENFVDLLYNFDKHLETAKVDMLKAWENFPVMKQHNHNRWKVPEHRQKQIKARAHESHLSV
jgi:hypothetical protein